MRLASALLVLAAAGSAAAQPVPRVLLVQTLAPVENQVDLNVPVRGYFAKEFDEDGRLETVSWAMVDPVFRQAYEEKAIAGPPESPDFDTASAAAPKLKCEYVFLLSALRHNNNVYATAQLYRGRRQIWKGETVLQAIVGDQLNLESSARSLARTWILQMAQGPLKDLKPRPKINTPEPDPGTKPVVPPVADPVRGADNAAIRGELDRRLKAGDLAGAASLMYDAVDVEPLDLERRLLLLEVLLKANRPDEAKGEARRAAGIFPESVGLWRMCARAAIDAGDYAQAIRDLNEAVTREPDSPETRMLLGVAQWLGGRTAFALEHLDASMRLGATAEAAFFRGFVRMTEGDAAGSEADLKTAVPLLEALPADRKAALHRLAFRSLVLQAQTAAAGVRTAMQKVRLDPKDRAHPAALAALAQRVESLAKIAGLMAASPADQKSHDALVLALNLLGQCIGEVQQHAANPGSDAIGDATITLGEAFRALEAAQPADRSASPGR